MVVAKRQRSEKPMKKEQMKVRGPEWEPQAKEIALLASPIYIGQARGERRKHERSSQYWTGAFFPLCCFWVGPSSCLKDIFSFAYQIKLSCNIGPSFVQIFAAMRHNWGNYTPPTPQHPLLIINAACYLTTNVRSHWEEKRSLWCER